MGKRTAAEMADQRAAADQPAEVFRVGRNVRHLFSEIRAIPDNAKFKEVLLWELLCNANWALLQYRRECKVEDNNHGAELAELYIHIVPDKKNGTLTIIDNGIGMDKDELQSYFCDIPKHVRQKYRRTIKKYISASSDDIDLSCLISHDPEISLGFHSVYMVADKVMVTTKKFGGDQYVWGWELKANGCHSYTIARDTSGETKLGSRGTAVTLFLNHNHLKYVEEHILNDLIKKYVKLLIYPVYILVDDVDDQKKTKKEIVDYEKQKEELVPMDIWWDDELRHCVSIYIREKEFKQPIPVQNHRDSDSSDQQLPSDDGYREKPRKPSDDNCREKPQNWFSRMTHHYGRRDRRRENGQFFLKYTTGIRPVHVRCILPGTAIDLVDVMFFEFPWVAVRGIDAICVVAMHKDISRLMTQNHHPRSTQSWCHCVRVDIWNIPIIFVEGILQAYFPDSFCESRQMSANKSPKSPSGFGVASCDEPCEMLHKSSKKPFGVFALIGGSNKDNEISGTHDGEKFAVKFLEQQMSRNIGFTYGETIQTAKTAFQYLCCQKLKDDELRVFVFKNDGSLGKELNPEHECLYWKFGPYSIRDEWKKPIWGLGG